LSSVISANSFWPDQLQEAAGIDELPAVGFEFSRSLVDHEVLFLRRLRFQVISSMASLL
jgi:hypothetical protein